MGPAVSDGDQQDLNTSLAEGWVKARTGQWQNGLADAQRLFVIAQDRQDDWALAEAMLLIAWFSLQMGHASDGIESADGAKRLYLRCGDRAKHAFAASVQAWLLMEIGLIDEGFAESQTALTLAEAAGDAKTLAFALHTKAIALTLTRQHELALPVLKRALEAAERAEDLATMSLINNSFGYSYGAKGDVMLDSGLAEESRPLIDTSIAYFITAAEQAQACGDIGYFVTSVINRAESETLLDQVPRALELLDTISHLPPSLGPRSEAHYIYTRAQALLRLGQTEEALGLCERALELAQRANHLDNQVNAFRRLSEVYEMMGNYELALHNHRKLYAAYHQQMGVLTQRRAQMSEMRLENARLRTVAEQFEQLATHDALTDLPNRRSFDATLAGMVGSTFAIGILDLDHFKLVNDRHSHGVGDDVLRRTGALLAAQGEHLTAFRLGGEEFALVFAHGDVEQAWQSCEQVRTVLQSFDWNQVAKGLHVTCSIGLAVGEAPDEIMPAADRRLYRAKAAGRNQVIAHDLEMVSSPMGSLAPLKRGSPPS